MSKLTIDQKMRIKECKREIRKSQTVPLRRARRIMNIWLGVRLTDVAFSIFLMALYVVQYGFTGEMWPSTGRLLLRLSADILVYMGIRDGKRWVAMLMLLFFGSTLPYTIYSQWFMISNIVGIVIIAAEILIPTLMALLLFDKNYKAYANDIKHAVWDIQDEGKHPAREAGEL